MRVANLPSVVVAVALAGAFGLMDKKMPAAQSEPALPLKEVRERGIEGTLGWPLGTVVEVSGKVVANTSRAKADAGEPFFLRIDEVDGHKLATPTLFSSTDMPLIAEAPELKIGDRFRCVGYESGSLQGTPGAVFKHVEPFATERFHFAVHFVVVNVRSGAE
jgi:hypothetical protein